MVNVNTANISKTMLSNKYHGNYWNVYANKCHYGAVNIHVPASKTATGASKLATSGGLGCTKDVIASAPNDTTTCTEVPLFCVSFTELQYIIWWSRHRHLCLQPTSDKIALYKSSFCGEDVNGSFEFSKR